MGRIGRSSRSSSRLSRKTEEVELGQADFSTESPPRGAARWRHGGDKSQHVPRAAEPDLPVSYDSPGVARPGEGRLRVIGDAEIPAIPNVQGFSEDAQPMARLRDCFGMHERAYPPRVMKALRAEVERRPKNVSFSQDNGYWMPEGCRLEIKICPRDSAVPTDRRHSWSRKWTWSLWPMGNVPGTWVWNADEEGVAPSDMHVWPSTARPILSCIYICPTESYKEAQHECIDQVQLGRKHSTGSLHACPTWEGKAPPREKGPQKQTLTPPRETLSMHARACQTSRFSEAQTEKHMPWCAGMKTAPSRRFLTDNWPAPSRMTHHHVAWDKAQRLGEANNPGPEPPREIWLRRKNGQRDPLRLCTQNGGWVWNMHYAPPLRVAKRPTPHDALRNWLTKHEPAIEPESVEAARQLKLGRHTLSPNPSAEPAAYLPGRWPLACKRHP